MAHGTDTLRTHSKNRLTYTRDQVKFVTFAHKRADSLSSLKWAFTVVSVEGVREQKKKILKPCTKRESRGKPVPFAPAPTTNPPAGARIEARPVFPQLLVFWPAPQAHSD